MKAPIAIACPRCGAGISEQEIKSIWGRYTNANRKSKGGGRPASSPPSAPIEAVAVPTEPEPVSLPSPVTDRMAGLRSLLGKAEQRVGLRPRGAPADVEPEDLPAQPTPFDRSNNRRAWSEKFAELRRLGQFDEAGAGEGFAELVRGHQLPGGFGRWSDAKKIDWLTENLPLEEE